MDYITFHLAGYISSSRKNKGILYWMDWCIYQCVSSVSDAGIGRLSHLFYCILDHIDYIFDCKFLFRQVPDRGCYGAGKNKMAHHYSDNNCDSDRMSASSI